MEFWNTEMDQMLTRLWSNQLYTTDEIADRIGRSRTSVKTRAWRLELGQRTKRIANEWAERDMNALRRLWEEGLSASQIGERLTKTRNAVLGKAHRLGLKERRPRHYAKPGRKVKPKTKLKPLTHCHEDVAYIAARIKARLETQPEFKPVPGDEDRDDLIPRLEDGGELTRAVCHWPIGPRHGPIDGYCGHPTVHNSRYCQTHHARAYVPIRPRPKRGHHNYSAKRTEFA